MKTTTTLLCTLVAFGAGTMMAISAPTGSSRTQQTTTVTPSTARVFTTTPCAPGFTKVSFSGGGPEDYECRTAQITCPALADAEKRKKYPNVSWAIWETSGPKWKKTEGGLIQVDVIEGSGPMRFSYRCYFSAPVEPPK